MGLFNSRKRIFRHYVFGTEDPPADKFIRRYTEALNQTAAKRIDGAGTQRTHALGFSLSYKLEGGGTLMVQRIRYDEEPPMVLFSVDVSIDARLTKD